MIIYDYDIRYIHSEKKSRKVLSEGTKIISAVIFPFDSMRTQCNVRPFNLKLSIVYIMVTRQLVYCIYIQQPSKEW